MGALSSAPFVLNTPYSICKPFPCVVNAIKLKKESKYTSLR